MHLAEHEQHCIEVFGEPFTDIHLWLDQYFLSARGVAHRIALHHRLGIELGVEKFGEKARAALELHVQDDFLAILPGPYEVAMLMLERNYDIYPVQPVLDMLWPGRFNLWDYFD